jgi:hypothetical protein
METQWKWFIGFAPSIQWDIAFQGEEDLLSKLEAEKAPERIKIRRPSRLELVKDEKGGPIMKCVPWVPKFFEALNKDAVGVVSRGLFLWVMEATGAAAEDWDKEWEPNSNLLVLNEQQAGVATEALAKEAKAKLDLTRHLKNPHLQRVK